MDRPVHDLDALMAQTAWLRGLAASLVRDASDADDVVQETLVSALERRPEDRGAIRAFLAAVARNVVRDRHRTGARRAKRERDAARDEAIAHDAELAERFEVHKRVVEAVDALDEPYRSVVLMRWFEGLPPRAIAERLDVPVKTVHTRTARALEKLRARLDREHGGDRRAWMLALARGLELEGAAKGGVLVLMSAKAKLAAALLLVLLGAWWVWSAFTKDEHVELASGQVDKQVELAGAPQDDRRELEARDARPVEPRASAIVPTPVPDGPHITIRAVDASNAPMSAVRVTIAHSPVAGSGIPDALVRDVRDLVQARTTGADGFAYFEVPPWRTFDAQAELDGAIPLVATELVAGAEHVFRIGAPATLKGRVVWIGTNEPIANALVAYDFERYGERHAVRSGADGAYSLAGICTAPAPIYVVPPEGSPLFLDATLASGATVEQDFYVPRAGVVSGVVRDARTRAPIAGARVELVSARMRRSVASDAEGRYAMHGLVPKGGWKLRARADGYASRTCDRYAAAQPGMLDFDLERERRIVGRVVDARGRAMAGVFVAAEEGRARAQRESDNAWNVARSDVDGAFELRGIDPHARPLLHLHAEGRGSRTIELDDVDPARLLVDLGTIVVSGSGTIRGRVEDELGVAIVDARVESTQVNEGDDGSSAVADRAAPRRAARTGADGSYVLLDVPEGRHAVNVMLADRFTHAPELVDVRAGETREHDVRLSAPIAIRGFVLDVEGKPCGGARISTSCWWDRQVTSKNELLGRTLSAPDGTFEIGGLQPGRYSILAQQPGEPSNDPRRYWILPAFARDVQAGAEGVVLRLQKRVRVVARVVDASGAPVEHAEVAVTRDDGYGCGSSRTDADGRTWMNCGDRSGHHVVVRRSRPARIDPTVGLVERTDRPDLELDFTCEEGKELLLRLPEPPR